MLKSFLVSIWRRIQKLLGDGNPTMVANILLLASVVLLPVVVLTLWSLMTHILNRTLLVLQSWMVTMSGILLDLVSVFNLAVP